MVIGIDASQANRKLRSGTEWYAFHLISEFKKLLASRTDVKVRLYVRDKPQLDLTENLPENFKFKLLRWPLKYFWAQGRLSLEMLFYPPDVLFCPAHTIPLVHPQKTFTVLHDVGFEDYPELYDKLSLWYHKLSARLAIKTATRIFTVSDFSKQRIVEVFDYPAEKIIVTHLGIDQKSAIAPFSSIMKKYNLRDKGYILFVGRLEPKKNILKMIKGYEMSGVDFPLVLAGRKLNISDVEAYLSSRPKLARQIKFLGYFDEADKPALYSGAKLFLFPTLYEGFGLPIIEAQACGIPVVTSNTASNAEIAGIGGIIVDPESIHEIADAIRIVISDQKLYNEKVRDGFENIKRFDWEATAGKTLEKILEANKV